MDFQDFLVDGDGGSKLWTELLSRALRVHGINCSEIIVYPDADSRELKNALPKLGVDQLISKISLIMLFDRHRWKGEVGTLKPEVPETDTIVPGEFTHKLELKIKDLTTIAWKNPEVTDRGRPGQGGRVLGQTVVQYVILRPVAENNTDTWTPKPTLPAYFDPSLGIGPFNDLQEYEESLLFTGRDSERSGGFGCHVGWRDVDGLRKFFYGAVRDWEGQQLKSLP